MRFTLLHGCFALLCLSIEGSHALTPEVYWKYVLPYSPMPKAIKEFLTEWEASKHLRNQPSSSAERSTFLVYGASKDQLKDQPSSYFPSYGASKDQLKDQPSSYFPSYGASKDQLKDQPSSYFPSYGASKDQLKDQPSSYFPSYGASKDQQTDHPKQSNKYDASEELFKEYPTATLFFLEDNLHQGREMELHFTKNDHKTTFLPREIVDLIPFSSNNLPQIYNIFSVKPYSIEGKYMKQTLNMCEQKGIEGEEKYCATSLESMVDFSTKMLGKKVKALSTEINSKESTPSQNYKIEWVKKLATNKTVSCHNLIYVHAVFYCHISAGTRVYAISLAGADGTKGKSMAICHTDTTKWKPDHLAFQVLKVKPGTVPVCHFLPEDHVVWVSY
ncbi:hypothetical protein L1987_61257 [Smallanthus sonchifolius]|uniref:Uncharacterized protein n=1 Tax=Smallanthus sonchifolius TaxID=185202 RepID=A0ACB9DB64_9ASTR|nr:hypothetical protein L1987_61257 [Smallanthus sonchifolius]